MENGNRTVGKLLGLGFVLFITPIILITLLFTFGIITIGEKVEDLGTFGFGECKNEIADT